MMGLSLVISSSSFTMQMTAVSVLMMNKSSVIEGPLPLKDLMSLTSCLKLGSSNKHLFLQFLSPSKLSTKPKPNHFPMMT